MRYDIRLAGALDANRATDFADADISVDGDSTVLSVDVDQAGLHGVLERVRLFGIELIEVRRVRTAGP
jgi:hypothetical protein